MAGWTMVSWNSGTRPAWTDGGKMKLPLLLSLGRGRGRVGLIVAIVSDICFWIVDERGANQEEEEELVATRNAL